MKIIRQILGALLCAVFLVGFVSASAEDYSYTIRVYAGKQGEITVGSDPKVYTVSGLGYGEIFRFDYENWVKVPEGSKYEVRGIRESARDNNTVSASAFYVTRDMDYVVAYRIPGTQLSYTIRYVEYGTDRELLPPSTYYGNEGDEVVVAFPYIDGYTPAGLNGRWTLRADASNDRTFWYVSSAALTSPTPSPTTTPENRGANESPAPEAEPAVPTQNAQQDELVDDLRENGPDEILDMEIPMQQYTGQDTTTDDEGEESESVQERRGVWLWWLALVLIAVGAIIWYGFFYRKRRKGKNDSSGNV